MNESVTPQIRRNVALLGGCQALLLCNAVTLIAVNGLAGARLAPTPAYRLPSGVLVMMLVWLLLCASGLMTALGLGAIANAAHVGGLLAGCLAGLLGGALARRHR